MRKLYIAELIGVAIGATLAVAITLVANVQSDVAATALGAGLGFTGFMAGGVFAIWRYT